MFKREIDNRKQIWCHLPWPIHQLLGCGFVQHLQDQMRFYPEFNISYLLLFKNFFINNLLPLYFMK